MRNSRVENSLVNARRECTRLHVRVRELEEAAAALVAWDERWPENRIHSASRFQQCHDELATCIDSFRVALGEKGEVDG